MHRSSISSVSSRYAQLPVAPFTATSADELTSPVAINPIVDAMTQLTAQLDSLDTVPLDDLPTTENEPIEVPSLGAYTQASHVPPFGTDTHASNVPPHGADTHASHMPPTSYAFNGDEHVANAFSNALSGDAAHSASAASAVFVAPMGVPIVPSPPLVAGSSVPPSSSTCFCRTSIFK